MRFLASALLTVFGLLTSASCCPFRGERAGFDPLLVVQGAALAEAATKRSADLFVTFLAYKCRIKQNFFQFVMICSKFLRTAVLFSFTKFRTPIFKRTVSARIHGTFPKAPKFPSASPLRYLQTTKFTNLCR